MNKEKMVSEFHKAMSYCWPSPEQPHLTDFDKCWLRVKLLVEEVNEFAQACKDENAVEVLDALCDIQYVLSGAVLSLGYDVVFDEAFRRVHANNMDKFWTLPETASKSGEGLSFDEVPGKGFIARRADHKIVKPPHHKKVDLTGLIP